jgi:predicted AAA+ superfamily ATPase
LQDAGAIETIAHYLALLEEAFLVTALPKYATRAARRRAAPPKLVTLNNALVAAIEPGGPGGGAVAPERFGALVENACLAHAWNAGQTVTYWREEPLEVDGVIEGSWGRWAVEIKTSRFQPSDLVGLLEFTRRHRAFRPLVVCAPGHQSAAIRAGVPAMTWQEFLLRGPPGSKSGAG